MASRFHLLPLRGITVFEAAARNRRFTAAAAELSMTQAGVSQHIAQLEAELGVELFVRGHRGVQLTSAGAILLESVESGLRTLADGVAKTQRQASRKTITIMTDYSFAAWWLMPRLNRLAGVLPGVDVQLATCQLATNLDDSEFDIAIKFGAGDWPAFRTTPLFQERVYPVCSPALLDGRGGPIDADAITALRLLHIDPARPGRWFTWNDWFMANGSAQGDRGRDLTFDNFHYVLQAALLGRGVCLGWAPLIDELVEDGGLVRLSAEPLLSTRGFYLLEHPDRLETPYIAALKKWLHANLPDTVTADWSASVPFSQPPEPQSAAMRLPAMEIMAGAALVN